MKTCLNFLTRPNLAPFLVAFFICTACDQNDNKTHSPEEKKKTENNLASVGPENSREKIIEENSEINHGITSLDKKLSIEASRASALLGNDYLACAENSGGVTEKIIDCLDSEYKRQDEYLNEIYRDLMALLPDADKDSLLARQREWIREKQSDCTDKTSSGGQAALIEQISCELNKTAIRANELAKISANFKK